MNAITYSTPGGYSHTRDPNHSMSYAKYVDEFAVGVYYMHTIVLYGVLGTVVFRENSVVEIGQRHHFIDRQLVKVTIWLRAVIDLCHTMGVRGAFGGGAVGCCIGLAIAIIIGGSVGGTLGAAGTLMGGGIAGTVIGCVAAIILGIIIGAVSGAFAFEK